MEYRTVAAPAQAEFTEKRSRFICTVAPVSNPGEAEALIAGVRKKYWDATHNVWAYLLFHENQSRFSDDGEPQGTAGLPALSVLRQQQVFDTVAVVTRYFGGTLLGAGGLVRAYSTAVKLCLADAEIVLRRLCRVYSLRLSYPRLEPVKALVSLLEGSVLETEFSQEIRLEAAVPAAREEQFLRSFQEIVSGETVPEFQKECYL